VIFIIFFDFSLFSFLSSLLPFSIFFPATFVASRGSATGEKRKREENWKIPITYYLSSPLPSRASGTGWYGDFYYILRFFSLPVFSLLSSSFLSSN
jgi:hypothetical protein